MASKQLITHTNNSSLNKLTALLTHHSLNSLHSMAYDEYMADRIKHFFDDRHVVYSPKRMFGGLCFMIDDKICCGLITIKKKGVNVLMARIGEVAYEEAILKEGAMPMDFAGRPMRGYAFVTFEGIDSDKDLEYWLQLCLDFNPLAKSSKKKAPKK